MNHPQDLLAAYVDGTATLPERAEVESHLTFCSICREEIELARTARGALQALPELDAPGIDRAALAAAPGGPAADPGGPATSSEEPFRRIWGTPLAAETAPSGPGHSAPTPSGPGRPGRRWPVRAAPAALAVAAVSIAVVVVVSLAGGGNRRTGLAAKGAVPQTDHPAVAAAPEHALIQDYTAKSLTTLANDLAQEAQATPQPFRAGSSPGGGTPGAGDTGVNGAATACVQRATGLGSSQTLYYAQGATYEGTAAYIAAFVTSSDRGNSLIVVAVSSEGCDTLQFIRLAI